MCNRPAVVRLQTGDGRLQRAIGGVGRGRVPVVTSDWHPEEGRVDYRILGPLDVCDGDRNLELGGDKQRALLAILLLHANELVSADRLIDDLWGEHPPPTALKTVQAYVSRLRKTLDHVGAPSGTPRGALLTRGHGYLLRVESGELDVDRFRGLVEQGRQALAAGEPELAAHHLREGLSLWRGPALGEFTYDAFAAPAIAQLEELQLGALEDRIDADLALGRQHDLVGELTELVERHPLRERLRGQLMLALYRCGRQAAALGVYQEFRRALSEQLGLDPSSSLGDLESAIHARDASLDAPQTSEPPSERAAITPGSRRPAVLGRGRLALGAAAAIAVTLAAVGLSAGGGATRLSVIAGGSVGAISPARGGISADVAVGSSPGDVAAGGGALWVANYSSGPSHGSTRRRTRSCRRSRPARRQAG